MYIAADNEWVPTATPNLSCLAQNFVIQWSCGYYPAGISYLGEGTLAIGDGTDGDASGGLALTGLLLYNGPYLTTVRGGASVNWTLTLPTTAGTAGQVLETNGSGLTSWVSPAGSFEYQVTSQSANYAAQSYDDVWCTGTFNVTLPSPTILTRVKVSNRGTGMITVIGAINGMSNLIIATQYASAEFASNGINWGIE
jgi:hypothetical protein